MATYYVDGKNGSDKTGNGNSNNPWKTLNHAHGKISSGDTVKLRTATYRKKLTISKNNTIWKAEDGQQPVLDGGYNEGLFVGNTLPPPDGYIPGTTHGNMIKLGGTGIVIDGLIIQNIAGVGVAITGDRCTVRNCRIDFCYGGGLIVNGGSGSVASPLIENNTITRCSMKRYDPENVGAGSGGVQGTLRLVKSENPIVRHNIVAYSYGEGITMGGGTVNGLVEGNVVHTCNHVHIYVQRGRDAIVRNNFVYHLGLTEHVGRNGDVSTGITIGDEKASDRYGPSSGTIIYNNIIVGMGKNFNVRNNTDNYNTQLDRSYIGHNTFIGGRSTRINVDISQNKHGRSHKKSLFENNIIYHSDAGVISKGDSSLSGLAFRNNLWSEQPIGSMRGQNDRIGDPRLANPEATINGTSPGPTNADPFNYRLTANSTQAIGKASDGSSVNGFQPPEVERDFFNNNRDNAPDIGGHEYNGVTAELSANFSIGPGQQSGMIPHTVDFTDRSTSDVTITQWDWDFGDGSTSPEQNPAHTFLVEGTYTVSLAVRNADGRQDTFVQPDLIAATPETPDITPDDFRRFVLLDETTSEALAFGSQYPDLTCVLLWNGDPFHILNYNNIQDVVTTYVEPGETSLMWLDPVLEPVGADD